MPETFDAQTRQCLDNVKAIVETAGLTMEHVVYTQVYLAAIANFDAMDRVYRTYFPRNPPARVVLGVARMPTDTPVEINAIVVRDLKAKRPVFEGNAAAPAAVVAGDRIFLSGIGSDQVQSALDRAESVLKLAGSDLGRAVQQVAGVGVLNTHFQAHVEQLRRRLGVGAGKGDLARHDRGVRRWNPRRVPREPSLARSAAPRSTRGPPCAGNNPTDVRERGRDDAPFRHRCARA